MLGENFSIYWIAIKSKSNFDIFYHNLTRILDRSSLDRAICIDYINLKYLNNNKYIKFNFYYFITQDFRLLLNEKD